MNRTLQKRPKTDSPTAPLSPPIRGPLLVAAAVVGICVQPVLAQSGAPLTPVLPASAPMVATATVTATNPGPMTPMPAAWDQAFGRVTEDPPPPQIIRQTHYVISNENRHFLFRNRGAVGMQLAGRGRNGRCLAD